MESSPTPSPGAAARSDSPAPGLLRLEGRDALALLHRLATSFLEDLRPGAARMAPFCDFRGRLLHRAAVARTGDGALWLMRDDAPGAPLAAFLERHVFRDDVRVTDAGGAHFVRGIPGGRDLAPGTIEERDGVPRLVQPAAGFAYAIEPPPGTPAIADDERRRIDQGWPRHGREIEASFTPFEVGIAHEVHLAKGCFTGQEALMRTVTYRGARRGLARLSGPGAPPPVPRAVSARGAAAGVLTSATDDGGGRWIGLAVLAIAPAAPDARLEIEGAGGIDPPAPFPPSRPLGLP